MDNSASADEDPDGDIDPAEDVVDDGSENSDDVDAAQCDNQ